MYSGYALLGTVLSQGCDKRCQSVVDHMPENVEGRLGKNQFFYKASF